MSWRACAAIGLLAWACIHILREITLAQTVFLAGPLVLVPLAFSLLKERNHGWLDRAIRAGHLPAALLLLTPWPAAGIPWLALTGMVALAGMRRLWHRFAWAELGIDVGMVYLVVGGGWTVLARFGARPLDFSDAIVQATATHFHYAGFILPVLASLAARRLDDRWSRGAVLGVLAGVPLVAVGITLAALGIAWVEWPAAWFMAGAGMMLAVQQFRLAWLARGGRSLLFIISGLSLAAGMVLAVLYALGNCLGTPWLDIPLMVRTHGVVNALGFALPGLLAQVDWAGKRSDAGEGVPASFLVVAR